MEPGEYLTLASPAEAETRVRGSVFVAYGAPVESEDEARRRVEAWSRPRFDATHHCTGWRLRDGSWRVNDDGEPSGSAGAPILAAIDGAGLVDVLVVVSRWFGGTKLGVGGLIRAYGDAAAQLLEAAPRRIGTPAVRLRVEYAYAHTSAVMRTVELHGAADLEHGYTAGGAAGLLELTLPVARVATLHTALAEATAGAVAAAALGTRTLYRAAAPRA